MRTLTLLPEDGTTTPAQAKEWAAWLQDWINTDFAPRWSQGAYTVRAASADTSPSTADWLVHLRNSTPDDPPGAGGYHTLDSHGNPVLHILMDRLRAINYPITVVLAHEAAETCVNRWLSAGVRAAYNGQPAYFQAEVGDPFEAGPAYNHTGGGQTLPACNYALPAYFLESGPGGPYDRLGLGTAPLTPTNGGRQYVETVSGGTELGSQTPDPAGAATMRKVAMAGSTPPSTIEPPADTVPDAL